MRANVSPCRRSWPTRATRRHLHHRRAGAQDGLLRRRGGPRHPGLPQELAIASLLPRGPAHLRSGGGEIPSEEAPFPRLLAESLLAPFARSGPDRPAAADARHARRGRSPISRRSVGRSRTACERAGRAPDAVTSGRRRPRPSRRRSSGGSRRPGSTAIGENYVQELRAMHDEVPGVRWHFIGTLQTSSAHHVAALADVVETVAGEKATDPARAPGTRGRPGRRRADRGRPHRRAERRRPEDAPPRSRTSWRASRASGCAG